jgi:hypothetical protein
MPRMLLVITASVERVADSPAMPTSASSVSDVKAHWRGRCCGHLQASKVGNHHAPPLDSQQLNTPRPTAVAERRRPWFECASAAVLQRPALPPCGRIGFVSASLELAKTRVPIDIYVLYLRSGLTHIFIIVMLRYLTFV